VVAGRFSARRWRMARRAVEAMMEMRKIAVAKIESARRG
jgi:hypothetical protein